jgi:hypothetical protein
MAILDKNRGCVDIDHRPEAHTPNPTYVSFPKATFLDILWSHFLVKNQLVLAFSIIENGRSWLFFEKMGVLLPLIVNQRLIHLTPHMFICHWSHS